MPLVAAVACPHTPQLLMRPDTEDRALVLRFYNERRKKMWACHPNPGHRLLAALENRFEVTIVTQNVDNLHERAGSTRVLHLHGELTKARSTLDPGLVYDRRHADSSARRLATRSARHPSLRWGHDSQ